MSVPPFGFGARPGDGDDDPVGGGPGGLDPFAGLFGPMGQQDLGAAFQRIGQLLSWEGGPVNWDLARDLARQGVAAGDDRSVDASQRAAVADAVRLAELWLDGATTLPAGAVTAVAWSRAEWVEGTLPAWKRLVEPVAGRVVDAFGATLGQTLMGQAPAELAAGMASMSEPLLGMMRSMGGAVFGAQVGQALGSLAGEVAGSTDVGLPMGPTGRAVLLPANVQAFGAGLGIPAEEVRLYLALREAAHHRLYAHVPWLHSHVLAVLDGYARGITIDTSRLEEAVGRIDPARPESLQEVIAGGLFEPETTPAQQAALARLETLLALVEGWVDEVVHSAAAAHLPSAAALREALRRKRATGGPAEATFAALVGLELRPRRLREAAALWAAVLAARGVDGRDGGWGHPDLLPTADDLDDPTGFASGRTKALDLSGLDDTQAPPDPERPEG